MDECSYEDDLVLYNGLALFALSVILMVLLSFLQRRRQSRLNCCCGVPGIYFPLDYVTGQPSTLLLTATLAALSTNVVRNILIGPVFSESDSAVPSQIASALLRIFYVLFSSVTYLPLLACSRAPVPIIGYFIGVIYSMLILFQAGVWGYAHQKGCLYMNNSSVPTDTTVYLTVAAQIPLYVCLILIAVWYMWQFGAEIYGIFTKKRTKWVSDRPNAHSSSFLYVQSFFNSTSESKDTGILFKGLRNCVSRNRFRYPFRFTAAIVGGALVVYELAFLTISRLVILTSDLRNSLDSISNDTDCSNDSTVCELLDLAAPAITALDAVLIAGPVIGLLLTVCQLFFITRNVGSHLRLAYRGDTSFMPKGIKLTPQSILLAGMMYPGRQIGCLVWGWFLHVLAVWFMGFILFLLVVAVALTSKQAAFFITATVIIVIANVIVILIQAIATRKLFLENDNEGSGKYFGITNRRALHTLSFIVYCFNGFYGFGSSITRYVASLVQSLICASRMDILLVKVPRLDKSHLAYLGYIQLEAIHGNHIVHVFVDLLIGGLHQRRAILSSAPSTPTNTDVTIPTNGEKGLTTMYTILYNNGPKQVRNRWHLSLLLLKYPDLARYRKTKLNCHVSCT